MEVAAMEVEDDLYFADLSKQISLLIMDDDEFIDPAVSRYPTVSLQGFSRARYPITMPSPYLYEQQACQREQSKGTGVFIPRSSHSRRKHRQTGKFHSSPSSSYNSKSHHHHHRQINSDDNISAATMASHVQYHHQLSCNNGFINSKRV